MEKLMQERYFLSANEANAEREMALTVLVNKFIDIATAHANSLGIGNPHMEHLNGGWVLSRLSLEMRKYPKVNEYYVVQTWVESFNRHFSVRCFAVENDEGENLGYARSIWMVMDIESHSNLGLSHFSFPEEMLSDRACPIPKQAKHKVLEGEGLKRERYTFQYCDLDFYRHVNTGRYVVLLLNQFPLSLYDSHRVERLELSFLQEARYGMEVEIASKVTDSEGGVKNAELTLTELGGAGNQPLLFSRIRFSPGGKPGEQRLETGGPA